MCPLADYELKDFITSKELRPSGFYAFGELSHRVLLAITAGKSSPDLTWTAGGDNGAPTLGSPSKPPTGRPLVDRWSRTHFVITGSTRPTPTPHYGQWPPTATNGGANPPDYLDARHRD